MKQRALLVGMLSTMLFAACTPTAATPTSQPITSSPLPTEELIEDTQENTDMPLSTEQPAVSEANADVTYVRAVRGESGAWTFHVTIEHPDTGWEDYADGWDVVLPDGTVIKPNPEHEFTRVLLHPHENEQPFTRSQSNIIIPEDVTRVTVRAHDLVDGFGGQTVTVDLTQETGENYEVNR